MKTIYKRLLWLLDTLFPSYKPYNYDFSFNAWNERYEKKDLIPKNFKDSRSYKEGTEDKYINKKIDKFDRLK